MLHPFVIDYVKFSGMNIQPAGAISSKFISLAQSHIDDLITYSFLATNNNEQTHDFYTNMLIFERDVW